MKIKLFTHDRAAHADDTFAVAILQMVYAADHEVSITRTRDPAILNAAAGTPGAFLLDVGGIYDPPNRLFDHHQPEGAGYRNPRLREWPFATAGLVWMYYGDPAVRKMHPDLLESEVKEVVIYIDETVMKYIDAVDCGVRLKTAGPSLSGIIASFNAAWYESEEDAFPLVVDLARVLLTNFINRIVGKIKARAQVRRSARLLDGRILHLKACVPWTEVVSNEMPNIMMAIYPVGYGAEQSWQMRTAVDSRHAPRIQLPQSWGGLERCTLAGKCNESGAIFCHRSLHLAGARSFDAIVNMAQQALLIHDRQNQAVPASLAIA